MNCQQIKTKIYEYCDGLLPLPTHTKVARHLNECRECHQEYQLTLLENEVLQDTSDIPPLSPAFTSMVISSLDPNSLYVAPKTDHGKGSKQVHRRNIWKRAAVTLALAAAAVGLCLYLPNTLYLGKTTGGADTLISYEQPANGGIEVYHDEASGTKSPDPDELESSVVSIENDHADIIGADNEIPSVHDEIGNNTKSVDTKKSLLKKPAVVYAAVSPPQQVQNTPEQALLESSSTLSVADLETQPRSGITEGSPEYALPIDTAVSTLESSEPAQSVAMAFSPPNLLNALEFKQIDHNRDSLALYDSAPDQQRVRLFGLPYVELILNGKTSIASPDNLAQTRMIQMGGINIIIGSMATNTLIVLADSDEIMAEEK